MAAKKILSYAAAMFCTVAVFGANVVSRIETEKGERWWGTFPGTGPAQPFDGAFSINCDDLRGRDLMMFSSLGRYVWVECPGEVRFDGAAFTITANHEVKAQKGGRNLREAYLVCCHKNCPPDASAPPPDERLLTRPVYETRAAFGMDHSAQSITEYAEKLLKAGFPPGIIVVADGWQHGNGSFEFDPSYYPDPKAFVDKLHGLGFSVMLTVTPFTVASGRLFRPGMVVCDAEGSPVVADTEGGYQACMNPSGLTGNVIPALQKLAGDYGVDGFDMDAAGIEKFLDGERLNSFYETWGAVPGEGKLMCRISMAGAVPHNGFMAGMRFDAGEPLIKALDRMFSAGMSGYFYCSPQWNGVATAGCDDNTAARISRFAAVMPVSSVPFDPFTDGGRSAPQILRALQMRADMSPYVVRLASESQRSGEPLVRCMEYNFPRSGFSDCSDQFMIGTRYLVAPLMNDTAERMVRLPRGVWTDAQGNRHKGPLVVRVKSDAPIIFELSK